MIYDSINHALYCEARDILQRGNSVSPRGRETKELLGEQFEISNPRQRVVTLRGRKWDPAFCIAEWLWYMRGSNLVEDVAFWAPHIIDFSDDKRTFYGAYGFRFAAMTNTLKAAIEKLRRDKDSRQAIVPIYQFQDTFAESRDIPCTLSWHFMIRNNKLDMFADMRSNDLFWGTPNDVFAFTMVQEFVARCLCLELGAYRHYAHSLHIYVDKEEKIRRWADEEQAIAWEETGDMMRMPDQKLSAYVQNHLNDQIAFLIDYERNVRQIIQYRSLRQDRNGENGDFEDVLVGLLETLDNCNDEWSEALAGCLLVGAACKLPSEEYAAIKSEVVHRAGSHIKNVALYSSMRAKYTEMD